MTPAQRPMIWLRLFVAALLLACGSAHALVPKTTGYRVNYTGSVNFYPTTLQACQAYMDYYNGTGNGFAYTVDWHTTSACKLSGVKVPPNGQTHNPQGSMISGSACPVNSTPSGAQCQCNAGYDEQGGQCVQNQCGAKQGQSHKVWWTAAWSRSPDDDAPWVIANNPGAFGRVCESGCVMDFESDGPCPGCRWTVSQSPNDQGLYRHATEFMGTYSGAPCSPGPDDQPVIPDDSKDPKCPGYVGEVNGVKGCFGTADKPVTNQPKTMPPDRKPTAGNPASGVNDGSTPATGSGGSQGGPSGAAQGGKGNGAGGTSSGTGTTNKPGEGKEQELCGAPGQPDCTVRVNEKGTPDGKKAFDGLNEQADGLSTHDGIKGAIDGIVSRGDLSPTWSWTFQFPTGCSPLVLDGFDMTLDVCRWQPMIHDIMSMLWLAATVFFLIGLFLRSGD